MTPKNCPAHFGINNLVCTKGCDEFCVIANPKGVNAALTDAKHNLRQEIAYSDMIAKAWSRELCEQDILFRPKPHWIDFMVLATQRVMALAKENGVKCCLMPELCTNHNCNNLLRHRLRVAELRVAKEEL